MSEILTAEQVEDYKNGVLTDTCGLTIAEVVGLCDSHEALRASLRDVQAKVEFEQKLNIDNTAAYCVQIDGLQAQLAALQLERDELAAGKDTALFWYGELHPKHEALQERCERLEALISEVITKRVPEGYDALEDGEGDEYCLPDSWFIRALAVAAPKEGGG